MNSFDIVIIVVTSFCLIRGLFKGLIGEISSIIGVVAGFYGAYTYYPMVSAYGAKWIDNSSLCNIAAFILLFSAILIVISLLSILIRKLLSLVFLGWVDRTFGLVFGAAKGILIVSVFLIMITTFLPGSTRLLKDSKLAPYVAEVSQSLSIFVSKNSRSDFIRKIKGYF